MLSWCWGAQGRWGAGADQGTVSKEGRRYRYEGGIGWDLAHRLTPSLHADALVTLWKHPLEGLHKMLWTQCAGLGPPHGALRARASTCPASYGGSVFGGSWGRPRALAAALASAGGSALNYSDEVGHTKDRNLFLIKTKQNSGPKPLGC